MHLDSEPEQDRMGLPAGWDLLCDNVRLAITLTGIVSGAAAQKRSQELLVEVAHKAHSWRT